MSNFNLITTHQRQENLVIDPKVIKFNQKLDEFKNMQTKQHSKITNQNSSDQSHLSITNGPINLDQVSSLGDYGARPLNYVL